MILFSPRQLLSIAQTAMLYTGFRAQFYAVPDDVVDTARKFAKSKGWEEEYYVNSVRADWHLMTHAMAQGYAGRLNNTADWDYSLDLPPIHRPETRFETKRMQNSGHLNQVAIDKPFNANHATQKWRDFDVFIPWYVKDDIFVPYAAVSHRLWAYDCWEAAWLPNRGVGGGRHLNLTELAVPYNAGVILL